MACRITNLKPPCGYNPEGIDSILLLDTDDYIDMLFDGDMRVTAIYRGGDFVEVEAPQMVARYTSTGAYTHTLETFVPDLSAATISQLHAATKRRYIVIFRTTTGRHFTFGYGSAGATVRYAGQTADNIGAAVTITAASSFPLFEVLPDAVFGDTPAHPFRWHPVFDSGATCAIDGGTDRLTGMLNAGYAGKVSLLTGGPLGADNRPASADNRQAVLVIEGGVNPDPLTFVQVGTFTAGAELDGEPLYMYDPIRCPPDSDAGWILETGFWEGAKHWLDDGIWNF